MALTEERPEILELESGDTSASTGAFARPTNATGWRAWFSPLTTRRSASCTAL